MASQPFLTQLWKLIWKLSIALRLAFGCGKPSMDTCLPKPSCLEEVFYLIPFVQFVNNMRIHYIIFCCNVSLPKMLGSRLLIFLLMHWNPLTYLIFCCKSLNQRVKLHCYITWPYLGFCGDLKMLAALRALANLHSRFLFNGWHTFTHIICCNVFAIFPHKFRLLNLIDPWSSLQISFKLMQLLRRLFVVWATFYFLIEVPISFGVYFWQNVIPTLCRSTRHSWTISQSSIA